VQLVVWDSCIVYMCAESLVVRYQDLVRVELLLSSNSQENKRMSARRWRARVITKESTATSEGLWSGFNCFRQYNKSLIKVSSGFDYIQ
jgi:hypothetical protein